MSAPSPDKAKDTEGKAASPNKTKNAGLKDENPDKTKDDGRKTAVFGQAKEADQTAASPDKITDGAEKGTKEKSGPNPTSKNKTENAVQTVASPKKVGGEKPASHEKNEEDVQGFAVSSGQDTSGDTRKALNAHAKLVGSESGKTEADGQQSASPEKTKNLNQNAISPEKNKDKAQNTISPDKTKDKAQNTTSPNKNKEVVLKPDVSSGQETSGSLKSASPDKTEKDTDKKAASPDKTKKADLKAAVSSGQETTVNIQKAFDAYTKLGGSEVGKISSESVLKWFNNAAVAGVTGQDVKKHFGKDGGLDLNEFNQAIEKFCKDKQRDKEVLLKKLTSAMPKVAGTGKMDDTKAMFGGQKK